MKYIDIDDSFLKLYLTPNIAAVSAVAFVANLLAHVAPQIDLFINLAFDTHLQLGNIGCAFLFHCDTIHIGAKIPGVMYPVGLNKSRYAALLKLVVDLAISPKNLVYQGSIFIRLYLRMEIRLYPVLLR